MTLWRLLGQIPICDLLIERPDFCNGAAATTLAKTKHTISQIGSHPTEQNEEGETVVKGEQNDYWITHVHEHGIQAISVVGGVAALITMVLLEGQLIDIASLGTMLLSPLVFWQKMQLNELGGMRKQQNELRHSVNRFTVENNKLEEANTQLEAQNEGYAKRNCLGAVSHLE